MFFCRFLSPFFIFVSFYSSITNQNGIASYTFSNISSSLTITASYNSASATCTILTPFFVDNGVTNDYNTNYTKSNNGITVEVGDNGTKISDTHYGDDYYIADVLIQGDFEVTVNFTEYYKDSCGMVFLNSNKSILRYIEFQGDTGKWNNNGSIVNKTGYPPTSDTIKVTRVGSTLTLYVGSTQIFSATINSNACYFAWKTHSAEGRYYRFKNLLIKPL